MFSEAGTFVSHSFLLPPLLLFGGTHKQTLNVKYMLNIFIILTKIKKTTYFAKKYNQILPFMNILPGKRYIGSGLQNRGHKKAASLSIWDTAFV